jgi:BirA family biotin operon repressor/biotin-[acetyl-CoA-carboxylase] ligase
VEELSEEVIKAGLRTRIIGCQIHYQATLASTNDLLRQLADQGVPEGTLVIANEQTAGRGRLGRSWLAPGGTSLLFSLLFRPAFLGPAQAQWLTMICGLAVAEAIEAEAPLKASLKWPNDILLAGRKAGGILTELATIGTALDHVVVGIGLNVNVEFQRGDASPDLAALAKTATSIAQELGHPIPRLPLLLSILQRIDMRYARLRSGVSPRSEWAVRLSTLGQAVEIVSPTGRFAGYAEGVGKDGALLLRLPDGTLKSFFAGDVTLQHTT